MTALNMAKHRNSPSMAFWRMIKEGNDHFEATHLEPKVDVCERHYVFDAQSPNSTPLHFDPTGKCPVYKVPDDIAAAVKDKEQRDDAQFNDLVARGTDTVPVRTGMDGGMNPVFLSAVQSHGGTEQRITSANGSIPANIRPPGPRDDLPTGSAGGTSNTVSLPPPSRGRRRRQSPPATCSAACSRRWDSTAPTRPLPPRPPRPSRSHRSPSPRRSPP